MKKVLALLLALIMLLGLLPRLPTAMCRNLRRTTAEMLRRRLTV